MNLYQVRFDSDYRWIIADDFKHAHNRWKDRLIKENQGHDMTGYQPDGITLIAEDTQFDHDLPDILLPDSLPSREYEEEKNNE